MRGARLTSSVVDLVKLFSICLAELRCTVFLGKAYEIYLEAWCSKSIVVDIIVCLSLDIFGRLSITNAVIWNSRLNRMAILILYWRLLNERCG